MLDWTNLINLAFTLINVLIAYILVRETITLRKVETEPDIAIFLEQNKVVHGWYDLVVKNIGHGAAYNLEFKYDQKAELLMKIDRRSINNLGFFEGVRYLSPNQEYRTLFGGHELFSEPIAPTFSILVVYMSKGKNKYSEAFDIAPMEYRGTQYFGEKTINDIHDRLKDIAKEINNIGNQ